MTVITLITDFGTLDEYVGLMKGVILCINPKAKVIDISHNVEPQNIKSALYMLKASYSYFPAGTIHIAVVDPSVGTDRAVLAVNALGYTFLGPDNGILTPFIDRQGAEIVKVENSEFFLDTVSRTFHGRDIFAPVGGHISKGIDIKRLGPYIKAKDTKTLNFGAVINKEDILGSIIYIDRFGNLITDIKVSDIEKKFGKGQNIRIEFKGFLIEGFSENYQGAGVKKPLAIEGSRGFLEIAVNKGNAASYLGAAIGDIIDVFKY